MTIKAHFDGKVFVPDEPLDLAQGAEAEITLLEPPPEQKKGITGREIVEFIEAHPELKRAWEEIAAGRDSVTVAQELRRQASTRKSVE